MNRDDLEQKILLAESGELPAAEQRALELQLAGDPVAAAFRDDTRKLIAVARIALPAGAASPALDARLRAAASARHAAPAGWWSHPPAWTRPLALAATLAIIAGTALYFQPADPRHARIAAMHAMVVMSDAETSASVAPQLSRDADSALHSLAQQLLEMEGMAADDYAVGTWTEEDSTPAAERVPTAFQPRNTVAHRARTYG